MKAEGNRMGAHSKYMRQTLMLINKQSRQESTGNKPLLTRHHSFPQKNLDALCISTMPLNSSAYIKMCRWWVYRRRSCKDEGATPDTQTQTYSRLMCGRQAAVTWCHLGQITAYLSGDVGGPAACYHTLLLNNTTASFDPYPHTVRGRTDKEN